ncbi:MAG: hypothetical protein LBQ80_05225 [Clostridium sp.]|jgi:hypothetical protein|nr:hypothetical protein [Clostridium sp.]
MKKMLSVLLLAALLLCVLPFAALADYPDHSDSLSFIDNMKTAVAAFKSGKATSPKQAAELARALADEVSYSCYTMEDGRESVLISFSCDTDAAAALLSPAVLREFAAIVAAEQEDYASSDAVLMGEARIIGEARLHIWGYWFTRFLGGASGLLKNYYEDFRIAELNYDENRLPLWFMLPFGLF